MNRELPLLQPIGLLVMTGVVLEAMFYFIAMTAHRTPGARELELMPSQVHASIMQMDNVEVVQNMAHPRSWSVMVLMAPQIVALVPIVIALQALQLHWNLSSTAFEFPESKPVLPGSTAQLAPLLHR